MSNWVCARWTVKINQEHLHTCIFEGMILIQGNTFFNYAHFLSTKYQTYTLNTKSNNNTIKA